jgi:RNA polymerase sigma-70 factor (ECF subfamily)
MVIPPEVVVALFFFIADTFPDHASPNLVNVGALITRAQRGDRDAVATLYTIYAQAIFRYIVCRVPTTADAEDLTAEVFVSMVENLPTYQITGAPFEAWLYRIASARTADFYRKFHRRPQTELSDNLHDGAPLPEEEILQKQTLDQLRAALRQLPEDYQSILILRFVERKSHEEVAQLLDKSVAAVKSAQHRALTRLTELLGSNHKVRHYLRGKHE